jgi:long-chain acyl-CoA synthetase
MNIASWLQRAGTSHPDRPAVGCGTRVVQSYGALAKRAAQLAGGLRKLGLKPGDRVAIAAKNCVEYIEAMHAIWHAGLAAVPANAKLHGRELGYILEQSGARACFTGKDIDLAPHAPKSLAHLIVLGSKDYEALFAEPLPVEPRNGADLAWLFYTSGTTGRPKGAMLSHRSLAQA